MGYLPCSHTRFSIGIYGKSGGQPFNAFPQYTTTVPHVLFVTRIWIGYIAPVRLLVHRELPQEEQLLARFWINKQKLGGVLCVHYHDKIGCIYEVLGQKLSAMLND